MDPLISETRIAVADATGLAARMVNHLAEHDITFEQQDGLMVAKLPFGTSTLAVEAEMLKIRVEAPDKGKLEMLRSVVASHVIEFAGEETPTIVWEGHESNGHTLASFREVQLKASRDLTPHMRRLTFVGDDIARFVSDDDLHVRMYFPPEGLDKPEWPWPAPDGRIMWPEPDRRPVTRYYTIRRIDAASREIDVDFVLHDHAGPGSDFALKAKAGAICGMAGPLGRGIRPARWFMLAGDETALPAIARILESLPATASGEVFLEVADQREELPLTAPSGMSIRWLHRGDAPPGSTQLLAEGVHTVRWPEHPDIFAWVAAEAQAVRGLRKHLRDMRGLTREQHLAVAYWSLRTS
ncbi:siderophore-interacting protein [Bradyrhizobium sp. LHD-71]|uniref:siderophore-interacting protein n=1 Tax=Bradyrhizobium sp. LHD-71 TaxID=3072141 RepID=UPI00280E63FF|nr:siderophore-interacting protein [Bradyrhizobium sp. LHD-71]MDQ8728110.1 siderophore-interacting protein [Bradyrhizobium sp. LHD-71]